MSNLANRSKFDTSLMPSTAGKAVSVAGAGALAVWGIAALLPGGVFLWAMILIIAGLVF